ncbi:unnamed protein product [Soboliphyme baturini]|uniref:Uncharacterized protein n=1 Tax=Soboliphyme baturini TaxID=241478 RepID=A0A183IAR8_9BILA|nr:unnamed protein product [Soboliphyme baturini]
MDKIEEKIIARDKSASDGLTVDDGKSAKVSKTKPRVRVQGSVVVVAVVAPACVMPPGKTADRRWSLRE